MEFLHLWDFRKGDSVLVTVAELCDSVHGNRVHETGRVTDRLRRGSQADVDGFATRTCSDVTKPRQSSSSQRQVSPSANPEISSKTTGVDSGGKSSKRKVDLETTGRTI